MIGELKNEEHYIRFAEQKKADSERIVDGGRVRVEAFAARRCTRRGWQFRFQGRCEDVDHRQRQDW